MNVLHVRNVPGRLYKALRTLAGRHRRSLTAEVIHLLHRAVEDDWGSEGVQKSLERIRRTRATLPPRSIDSASLLRADRRR